MTTRRIGSWTVGAALVLQAGLAFAQAGQTVKIAFIDPQSGPFANIGQNILRTFQLAAERESVKRPTTSPTTETLSTVPVVMTR